MTVIVTCPDCRLTVRAETDECRVHLVSDTMLLTYQCGFCDGLKTKDVSWDEAERLACGGVRRMLIDDPAPP